MLLTCLAVGLISCRDTVDPREPKPVPQVQEQEATVTVTVLELTCTLSYSGEEKGEVHCGEPGGGADGMRQSDGESRRGVYVTWLPSNLVRDTASETWSFRASVRNLLAQPIGTLDGTTATGSKLVVTHGPVATRGSGDVWIANADGTADFTVPNQPYFNYPWIGQPQQMSPYRELKLNVPNTVTEVTIGIAISTDFPAEHDVSTAPPDSVPGWLSADSSSAGPTFSIGHEFTKNAAIVLFTDNSTLAERQLAVALVGGRVIGGRRASDGSGAYYLWLPDDGTGAQLRTATNELKALPQVILAMPMTRLSELDRQ
jgi:hypothetical protein